MKKACWLHKISEGGEKRDDGHTGFYLSNWFSYPCCVLHMSILLLCPSLSCRKHEKQWPLFSMNVSQGEGVSYMGCDYKHMQIHA